jgi:hypothetical protein
MRGKRGRQRKVSSREEEEGTYIDPLGLEEAVEKGEEVAV